MHRYTNPLCPSFRTASTFSQFSGNAWMARQGIEPCGIRKEITIWSFPDPSHAVCRLRESNPERRRGTSLRISIPTRRSVPAVKIPSSATHYGCSRSRTWQVFRIGVGEKTLSRRSRLPVFPGRQSTCLKIEGKLPCRYWDPRSRTRSASAFREHAQHPIIPESAARTAVCVLHA